MYTLSMGDVVADEPQIPPRLTFGPFEVNVLTGELLKSGIRVRLPGQPFGILLILLKSLGEVVTREQLREQIWREGTFVDFEHGLNAAMNKLRTALGDSAEKPRYIETVPGRGYRFIGALDCRPSAPVSIIPASRTRERQPRWPNVGSGERLAWAAACLLSLAVGLQFHIAPSPSLLWNLGRITNEGVSNYPAISPDGNLVAYSSDAGLDG